MILRPPTSVEEIWIKIQKWWLRRRYPNGYMRVHGVKFTIPKSGYALTIPGGVKAIITDCDFVNPHPDDLTPQRRFG